MKIHTLILGDIQENCYIIETQNKNAVIIDSGDEAERILDFVAKNGLTVKKILITHGHFDHTGAVFEIVEKTGAEVYIHLFDAQMLESGTLSLASLIPSMKFKPFLTYKAIQDGDVITQDEIYFKVIHTPGHTPGGVCYICGDTIFSGDTLFAGTVGRVDFPTGSFDDIIKSVKKLAELDGDFAVLSGHGEPTTLEVERKTNVYITGTYNDDSF